MKALEASEKSAENQQRKHYQRSQAHAEEANYHGDNADSREKWFLKAAAHAKAADMHTKISSTYSKAAKAFKAGKNAQAHNHYQKAVDLEEDLTKHKQAHGGLPLKHASLSDHAGSADDEVAPAPYTPATP